MYLRATKRRNADGRRISYYQLAESVWDPERGYAVARVVYNFGRADQVDPEMLKRLAASILRVVGDPDALSAGGTIALRDAWPYGGVWVLEQVWNELGVGDILRQHWGQHRKKTVDRFERATFAMVANRALAPYSKLYCFEQWLREEVFLPSVAELELHHMYLGMDFLEEHKPEIEKAVYYAMADLMNAEVDLIFYDTTSLHFEVDYEDAVELTKRFKGGTQRGYVAQRKRGHSKNGRDDAPQIVIGLAVTRDGLPVRSWVFPGNTADVATVEKVKEDLRGWRLGRCVFVGDAGMNSEDNRRKLALGGGKYILASRMRAGDEVTKLVLTRAGRFKQVRDNLRVKEVIVGDGERRRRYVVCHNPDEVKRQRAHRARLLEELAAELAVMKQARAPGRHSKRACELLASARYGRYVRQTGTGLLRIDRTAVHDAERYDGKWVITTNDDTLTVEDLALGYKQLMRVEQCWRQLKTGLELRPVRHFRPWRIHAHVSIAALALLLERIVEIRSGDTWRNVLAQLNSIKVVEYDRGPVRVQQTTELRPEVVALLATLGVRQPPKLHVVEPCGARPDASTDETPVS